MEPDCSYCLSSLSFYYSYSSGEPASVAKEFLGPFHEDCRQCSASPSIRDGDACLHCQHLRLRHWIECVPTEIRRSLKFHLRPDLLDGVESRCPLCRIAYHMVSHAFDAAKISTIREQGHTIYFYLNDFQPSAGGIANVHLLYVDEGDSLGSTDEWVGDLHIHDRFSGKSPPVLGPTINWREIASRLTQCRQEHMECEKASGQRLPRGFRLIDIARRRIIETNDVPFVALSYVWGKDTRPSLLTATSATVAAMMEDGGLPMAEVPQTIEDAMRICTELGLGYLWADRLCIIQDDIEDKKNQIGAMDAVYSSASLVLAAGYGDNMDFGIPGLSRPRTVIQQHAYMNGLQITNVVREPEQNPLALWHTRGWTYQEAVCAKRIIHFTNTRTYFACRTAMFHEDAYNYETRLNAIAELTCYTLFLDEEKTVFESFARHLRNYSTRSLSFRSDTYNAFLGILTLLYGSDYQHNLCSGLPKADFDRAMRWFASFGRETGSRSEMPDVVCPTWSWSSTMCCEDEVLYQETDLYGALTVWYVCSRPSADHGRLQAINMQPETAMDDAWPLYMAIAWIERCLPNAPSAPSTDGTFSTMENEAGTRWPTYQAFCRDALGFVEQFQPQLDLDLAGENLKPATLIARTQIASFRLGRSGYPLALLDSENEVVGRLCGDTAHLAQQVESPLYAKDTMYEFIALSLSGKPIRRHEGEIGDTKNYFDKEGGCLAKLPIINVLLIGRRDRFAFRRELGYIYLKDWAKADRKWETIVLE